MDSFCESVRSDGKRSARRGRQRSIQFRLALGLAAGQLDSRNRLNRTAAQARRCRFRLAVPRRRAATTAVVQTDGSACHGRLLEQLRPAFLTNEFLILFTIFARRARFFGPRQALNATLHRRKTKRAEGIAFGPRCNFERTLQSDRRRAPARRVKTQHPEDDAATHKLSQGDSALPE